MRSTAILFATALAWGSALALPAGPARAEGAEQYQLCAQCHGDDGGGNQLFLAPAIAGLPEWYVMSQLRNFNSGARGTHPEDVGGLRMYPMSLALKTDQQFEELAAYVAAMPPTSPEPVLEGGDPAKGAAAYSLCASCHGADGAGNEAQHAPPLAGASDWYLLSSLQKYKAGVRGANPANPFGAVMRGMVATLADEQAMKDVIAHIMTLGR